MYIQNISSIVANLPKHSARNCLARMFLAQQLVAMVQSPARDPPTQGGAPAGDISSSVLHLLCYVEADLGWAPDCGPPADFLLTEARRTGLVAGWASAGHPETSIFGLSICDTPYIMITR